MKQIQSKHIFGRIVAVALLGFVSNLPCQSALPTISWQQLQQEMQKPTDLTVINVLPKGVCADCKIPGTLNIPYHLLSRTVKNWPKDRNIVMHCAGLNCPLGKYACEMLHKLGFCKVRLFDGGLRTWTTQGLPTIGRCRAGYLKG